MAAENRPMSVFAATDHSFRFALDSSSGSRTDTLAVHNPLDVPVTYKVKTTNPDRYLVQPSMGVLGAKESVKIQIMLTRMAISKALVPGPSSDRFKLMIAPVPSEASVGDTVVEMWKTIRSETVTEQKYSTVFVGRSMMVPELSRIDEDKELRDRDAGSVSENVEKGEKVEREEPVEEVEDKERSELVEEADQGEGTGLGEGIGEDGQESIGEMAKKVEMLTKLVESRDRELARLRMELEETKAETKRILKSVPKAPLSANKFVADPFGGVSVAQIGIMILLMAVLVKLFM